MFNNFKPAYIYHSIGNGTIKTTTGSGGFGNNTGYNVNPRCQLEVNGLACIHNGSPVAAVNNYMQSGSLTIGGININYGGGTNWNVNTAGLMLECLDNTEIAVHDAGNRVSSLMYFEGGASTNKITIGRNMYWGVSNTNIAGDLSIGNGLIYLPKSGNSTGTIKLGLGGTTGLDDTTNMKIEINGVINLPVIELQLQSVIFADLDINYVHYAI